MATTGAPSSNITEQFVREAPDIEAYKLGLMQSAKALAAPTLPAYQVAGMTDQQIAALQAGQAGIGAFAPYLQSGSKALTTGTSTLGEAADVLRGADTRNQFQAAQEAYNLAAQPAAALGNLSNVAGAGLGYLGGAGQDFDVAQQMAQRYAQGNIAPAQQMMAQSVEQAQAAGPRFNQAQGMLGASAQQAQRAAMQPGYMQAQGALGAGLGSLAGAAQGYNPQSAQAFMNPYQQQVIDESIRQINRQGDIERQNLQAQATRAGAFGGSREGVQRAELERGLSATRNAAITNALQQGYGAAQQQAQQAFEQQQQRQMAQGQGIANIGNVYGSLAGQQGQLGMQAASQLGQTGAQLGSLEAQRAQQALQAAQYGGNIGQQLAAQQLQQAQLGQGAAGIYGQLAGQQAGLAGQYAGVAGQQANILGQQSQLQQQLGQGIGNLAGQQFGIGQQMAQGLGSLGTQIGNLGVQQAALGQTAQQLGQNDVNFLYNIGAQQQRQSQAELDALRATKMQQAMQPYQQLAFQSDIYKGAPSTQMAVTQQQQAAPSPFQQIAGLGTGLAATAAVANKSGLF